MLNDQITVCTSIDQLQQGVRQFIGGTSPLHFSARSLQKLKEEAKTDRAVLHSASVDYAIAGDQISLKKKMQLNGAISARNSIVNKIDSLLKMKGL